MVPPKPIKTSESQKVVGSLEWEKHTLNKKKHRKSRKKTHPRVGKNRLKTKKTTKPGNAFNPFVGTLSYLLQDFGTAEAALITAGLAALGCRKGHQKRQRTRFLQHVLGFFESAGF